MNQLVTQFETICTEAALPDVPSLVELNSDQLAMAGGGECVVNTL